MDGSREKKKIKKKFAVFHHAAELLPLSTRPIEKSANDEDPDMLEGGGITTATNAAIIKEVMET